LRRHHFFEVLDQGWCPEAVRAGATDYLEAIISRSDIYRNVRVEIFAAVADCRSQRIIDLCSGGGGPWLSPGWRSVLGGRTVVLTDKFPSDVLSSRLLQGCSITCLDTPIDAANVPESLTGFRTMFSSFHHFSDTLAREVLGDAVRCGEGFAMAEVTSRTPRAFATILAMPALVWLLTPSIKPFRWSRILFTYLLPLIPLVVLWDGLVSCCRTRTPEELLELTKIFPHYDWKAGYAPGSWLAPVYLIGQPKQ
jgi:hypothetical protein